MNEALDRALAIVAPASSDDDRTALSKAKVRALMTGYDAKWSGSGYTATAIEQEFNLPIINPNTGKPSQNFVQAGKLDVRVLSPSFELLNMDHKTSSMDISDPASAYWRQLVVDSQVSMYALACWQQEEKIDGSIWDVIRKPTIRPANIAKAIKKEPDRVGTMGELDECGTYYGFDVTEDEYRWAQNAGRENDSLYEKRLTRDCLDRPSHYYQRRTIPRLDDDMLQWAEELWIIAKDIRDTQLRADKLEKRETAWFRNSGACMNYGTPCEYLGLCSGYEQSDSSQWTVRDKPHHELSVESKEDRWSVLSHSSIRCYQTCRRKAYYKYELRLEKADDEERDALFFGSMTHDALEAWWSFYLEA